MRKMRGIILYSFISLIILSGCSQTEENSSGGVSYKFHGNVSKAGSKNINGVSYDIVTFGDYPQSRKSRNVSVKDTAYVNMGGNVYYPGSDGNLYVELNGEYFKVEPVKWRVLTKDYDDTGKALLLAEDIIAGGIAYAIGPYPVQSGLSLWPSDPPSRFYSSNLRAYLNGLGGTPFGEVIADEYPDIVFDWEEKGFLQSVFTQAGISRIFEIARLNTYYTEFYDNETGDHFTANERSGGNNKLFVLSLTEVANPDYGFPPYDYYLDNSDSSKDDGTRIKRPTDYAVALGVQRPEEEKYGSPWWLRSGDFLLGAQVRCVDYDGYGYALYSAYDTSVGIVPALVVEYQ